jgi:SAM-dependent methyltransferase
LERHRVAWLFLTRKSDFFSPVRRRMLHFAPEPCLLARFRSLGHIGYTPADLRGGAATEKVDITNIRYPSGTFDVIFCSHVLEHVEDDRKAISELHRVLSPTGWAILMVPITAPKTYEDRRIRDPRQRELHFGQRDHVRRYGPDFVSRLRQGGMKVTIASEADCARTALSRCDVIFFSRK